MYRVAASTARRLVQRQGCVVQKRFASGPTYEPPTGRLFGEPVSYTSQRCMKRGGRLTREQNLPAGEVREKADWENVWNYGFGGACLLAIIIGVYRPDDT